MSTVTFHLLIHVSHTHAHHLPITSMSGVKCEECGHEGSLTERGTDSYCLLMGIGDGILREGVAILFVYVVYVYCFHTSY